MTNNELEDSLKQLNDAIIEISAITKQQCDFKNIRSDYASLICGMKKILEWKELSPDHETIVRVWLQVLDREKYRLEDKP